MSRGRFIATREPAMIPLMLARVAIAALLLAPVARAQEVKMEELRKPTVGRSVVATRYGIVAASQPLAARAGVQILEHGGNAVDAAIAANAVLGVVEPAMNGIGGDLFVIFYEASSGRLYGLNASGWSPSGLTPELLRSRGFDRMPGSGIYSVTVPGAVAGWDALRERFGALPLADVLAPAIFYAEEGFPLTEVVARTWAAAAEKLHGQNEAAATYLIDGRPPRAGEVFRNPELARSLARIAEQGRGGFYEGETAAAILSLSRELGGTMTAADLTGFRPQWVDPISTTYRGWTLYEIPPNTQGIAALMMVNLMERFPLGEYGFHSARALHVMIEAKKLAYADMLRYVGDPDLAEVPVAEMISKERAAERSGLIDPARAACTVEPDSLEGLTTSGGGETTYLSAIDQDGNIVSLIQSLFMAFGSGLVVPGSGFALQNRGSLFTLEEGHPNVLAPHKRPLHTIIPGFLERGDTKIGFGIMGGFNQAQAHAQFVANVVDYGFDIQEALEAGRFTKGTFQGCDVSVETLVPESVRAELEGLGHEVNAVPPRSSSFGWGQAVMSDGTRVHYGASEPRHDGAAIPQAPPVFESKR